MGTFWKTVQKAVDLFKYIGAASLVGMSFITCADVVGRRFFNSPIFGSVEIVGFMATLAVAMALPYAQQMKAHIGVELLIQMVSKRTQTIIDLCTGILSLALFAVVTWRMTIYAGHMKASGEVSMNLEFPEYIIIYIVAFCLFVFSVILIQEIIKNVKDLKTK